MPPASTHEDSPTHSPQGFADDTTTYHVRRAVRGDRDSLGWVVARLSPLLRAQTVFRLAPGSIAEGDLDDLVAEAWLVALRRLGDLVQSKGRFTPRLLAFLSTTTVHLINRRLDAQIRRKQVELGALRGSSGDAFDPVEGYPAEITGAVTRAARKEIGAAIEDAIDKLPESDRGVLILRGIEGLSNQEAATELGELATTVSHRYRRALEKLRNSLPGSVFHDLFDE